MVSLIQNLVGSNFWATVIMSLVPLIELKGGIVFARGAGFDFFTALLLAFIGSTIVFIPIYFLLKPILELLKKIKWFNKFALKVEGFFQSKADQALLDGENKQKKKKLSQDGIKMLAVFIFVAIPLPMTGVWTGTAVAVFLGLKFKQVVLPVILGNLTAGIIISLLAELCASIWDIGALDYILYALFALAIILLLVTIIKIVKQKPKKEDK